MHGRRDIWSVGGWRRRRGVNCSRTVAKKRKKTAKTTATTTKTTGNPTTAANQRLRQRQQQQQQRGPERNRNESRAAQHECFQIARPGPVFARVNAMNVPFFAGPFVLWLRFPPVLKYTHFPLSIGLLSDWLDEIGTFHPFTTGVLLADHVYTRRGVIAFISWTSQSPNSANALRIRRFRRNGIYARGKLRKWKRVSKGYWNFPWWRNIFSRMLWLVLYYISHFLKTRVKTAQQSKTPP